MFGLGGGADLLYIVAKMNYVKAFCKPGQGPGNTENAAIITEHHHHHSRTITTTTWLLHQIYSYIFVVIRD